LSCDPIGGGGGRELARDAGGGGGRESADSASGETGFVSCLLFASFAAISSCMLMGPGLAAGLAFPAAGEEEEAGASPSACLPGTSGAL
jgi:hypothetical protein